MAVGDVDSDFGGVGIATAAMPFADRNMMKSLQNPALAASLLLLALACTSRVPTDDELNLSFSLDRNQLVVDGLDVNGHEGRFVVGSAYTSTLIGSSFVTRHDLPLTDPFHLLFRDIHSEMVAANVVDLRGEMDAIIGADVLAPAIVIDFRNRLITRFDRSMPADPNLTHRWRDRPSYPLSIAGTETIGLVDTAVPDTLLVPSTMTGAGNCTRCELDVVIAGVTFQNLPVRAADIDEVRIGNRLLQHFLVTIDYAKRTTTLEPR